MICPFCNYKHDNEGDRYGCPNCLGEIMIKVWSGELTNEGKADLKGFLARNLKGGFDSDYHNLDAYIDEIHTDNGIEAAQLELSRFETITGNPVIWYCDVDYMVIELVQE